MQIGAHMRRTAIPYLKPILNTSKLKIEMQTEMKWYILWCVQQLQHIKTLKHKLRWETRLLNTSQRGSLRSGRPRWRPLGCGARTRRSPRPRRSPKRGRSDALPPSPECRRCEKGFCQLWHYCPLSTVNIGYNTTAPHSLFQYPINSIPDLLALKQESRIIRYCRGVLKVSTVFLSSLRASPRLLFSAQIMAWKWETINEKFLHPSNIW